MKKCIVALFLLLCITLFAGCDAPGEGELEQQLVRIHNLELENADLRAQLDAALEAAQQPADTELSPIMERLMEHPELIPAEGQLGGTMIYYPAECKLLNSRYLYAYAEDGHIAADMLVRYDENEDGSYEFSLVLYDTGGGWQTAEK